MDLITQPADHVTYVSAGVFFLALSVPFIVGLIAIWLLIPRPHYPDQED